MLYQVQPTPSDDPCVELFDQMRATLYFVPAGPVEVDMAGLAAGVVYVKIRVQHELSELSYIF